VVGRGGGDRPLVLASAGSDAEKLAETLAGPVFELAELALSEGRPVLREPDRGAGAGGPQPGAAVAVPLPGESEPLGALVAIQVGDRARFDAPQVDALSTLAALAAVALRNADLRDAQRNFFAHMTDLLVTALDSHLGYNRDHGRHVAENANRLGRTLGLDEKQLHRLHFAALLHDIGMLKFERKQHHNSKACAKHCTIGARMLATIRLWEELAPIVRHHHEWYDGRGYPDGLAGDSIPLEARLIAVCDAFDAMVSPTSYKMPMTVAEATRELRECAGSQFDPQVVEPFLELIEQGVVAPPG
jgi:putative nucleotidyltransferase with HDIG domain